MQLNHKGCFIFKGKWFFNGLGKIHLAAKISNDVNEGSIFHYCTVVNGTHIVNVNIYGQYKYVASKL